MSLIILTFTAVCLLLGVGIGLARGLGKTIPHFLMLVIASVLTLAFAGSLGTALSTADFSFLGINISGVALTTPIETVNAVISSNEDIASLFAQAEVLGISVNQAVIMVLSVVSFLVLFLALLLITWIAALILEKPCLRLYNKIFKKEVKPSKLSRASGAVLGLICAVLCVGMIFTPVMACVSLANNGLSSVGNMKAVQSIKKPVSELSKNGVLSVFSAIGFGYAGNQYLKNSSEVVYEGRTFYLTEEADTIFALLGVFGEAGVFDEGNNISDAILAALSDYDTSKAVVDLLMTSELLRSAAPGFAGYAVEKSFVSLGVPKNQEEAEDKMWDAVTEAIAESGLSPEQIREVYAKYMNTPEDPDIFSDENENNDTLALLFTLMDKLATIFGKYNTGAGDESSTSTNAALTVYLYATRVENTTLASQMKEEIRSSVTEVAGSGFVTEMIPIPDRTTNSVTYTDVSDRIISMEPDVLTVDDVKEEIVNNLKVFVANATEETNEKLATAISSAVSIIDSTGEGGKLDIQNIKTEDVMKIAAAIDMSPELKNITGTVIEAMSDAGKLPESIPTSVTKTLVEIIKNNSEVKLEEIAGAAVSGAKIADSISKSSSGTEGEELTTEEKEKKQEAVAKSLEELVMNLSDSSLALINQILNQDMLIKSGVPVKYASFAQSAVTTLFDELLAYKNSGVSADTFAGEAKFIMSLIDILKGGSAGSMTLSDATSFIGYVETSSVIANTVLVLGSSFDPIGVSAKISDADKVMITGACSMLEAGASVTDALLNLFGIEH